MKKKKTKEIVKKSIFINKNLSKNHKLKKEDLIALRPLKNGIPIQEIDKILGKKINKKIYKLYQLQFKDVI